MSEWRYIAQRALTGEFLEWELPMERDELSWALSGAGSLRGRLAPDVGLLRAADGGLLLDEWGTLLYAESGGQIRWGGILIASDFEDEAWQIEAAGFAAYPHGIPYTGSLTKTNYDPADGIAHVWDHVQSHPDGDLGVVVTGASSNVRIGTTAEPYSLQWHEAPDCGQEIDNLASEGRLDYVERHTWSGDEIHHEIVLGYPRLGRRRDDLTFIQGDNVSDVVHVQRHGDDFANEVVGIGAGEGAKSLRRSIPVRDGRLRRPVVYTDKGVSSTSRLDSLIRRELAWRRKTLEITSVTVRDHPNAVIGSWSLGDDVLIQAEIPWLGEVALWSRVVGWSLVDEHVAQLSLVRSDSFDYGA